MASHMRTSGSIVTGRSRLVGNQKGLLFATEWHFKDLGVQEVKRRFAAGKCGSTAFCYYDEDNYVWRVRCSPVESDRMVKIFLLILRDLIEQEIYANLDSDDEEDDFVHEDLDDMNGKDESQLLVRLTRWQIPHGIQDVNETGRFATAANALAMVDGFPAQLRHFSIKSVWIYDDLARAEIPVLTNEILSEIQRLTGCELVNDPQTRQLFVGASLEEDCHRAISKLENVRKYSKYQNMNTRPVHHVIFSEQLAKVRYQIKPVTHEKKYFQTILLDNLQLSDGNNYINLWQATTVRLTPFSLHSCELYVPLKPQKYVAATLLSEAHKVSFFWTNFTFCNRGSPLNNPARHFELANELAGEDDEVISKVSLSHNERANQPLGEIPFISREDRVTVGVWITPVAMPPFQPSTPQESISEKPSWDRYNDYDQDHNAFRTRLTSSSEAEAANMAVTDSSIPRTPAPAIQVPVSPLAVQDPAPEVETIVLDISGSPRCRGALLDSDMPAVIAGYPILEPVRSSSSSNIVPGAYFLEFERLQENEETSTRVLLDTVNQKASKSTKKKGKAGEFAGQLELLEPPSIRVSPPSKIHDPLPEFIAQLKDGFEEIMVGARGFRGELYVYAEFGRIVLKNVNPKFIVDETNDIMLQGHELTDILTPSYGYKNKGGKYPHPFFSRVVTTIPPDVDCLLSMTNSSGEKLWLNDHHWEIMYQFLGTNRAIFSKDTGFESFIIQMDGETFDTAIKKQRPLGEVYVHGAKRNWDIRLSAVGNEEYDDAYAQKFEPLATAIKNSLYIPNKISKAFLAFEIPESIVGNIEYVIDGIRAHRISRYTSTDKKSVLKVSEIMELDIHSISVPDTDIVAFKAIQVQNNGAYYPGCDRVDEWHEVNISSADVNKLFEQNKRLELGDEAGWTTEYLSKINAVEGIILPACQMLQQMDGIGWYNDNGAEHLEREPQPPSDDAPEPVRFQWW